MEEPILQIIDRERAVHDVREHFAAQIELLEDVTNYGSQILSRILDKKENGIDYVVVVSILFKHILTMLDSIATQVSHGNVLSAHLQARSILEVSLYIEWILKSDTIKRSKYYYVTFYRKENARILDFVEQNRKKTQLAQKIETTRRKCKDTPDDFDKAILEELSSINALLNRSDLKDITKEFEKIESKRKNKKKIVDWYVPTGVENLRSMADALDLTEKHYIFYNRFSKLMHAVAINDQVAFDYGKIYLKPLRELVGIDILLPTALADIFRSYRLVLEKYLPSETQEFAKKFNEKWREPFMNIKKVKYQ